MGGWRLAAFAHVDIVPTLEQIGTRMNARQLMLKFMTRGCLLISLFSVAPAHAMELAPSASSLFEAASNRDALATEDGRSKLVTAVYNYCSDLDRAYPTNSPAEDQWLDGEVHGGGDRTTRALASAELGRRQANAFTKSCISISRLQKRPASARDFTALGFFFVQFMKDSAYYARKNNVNPEKYGFDIILHSAVEALLWSSLNAE